MSLTYTNKQVVAAVCAVAAKYGIAVDLSDRDAFGSSLRGRKAAERFAPGPRDNSGCRMQPPAIFWAPHGGALSIPRHLDLADILYEGRCFTDPEGALHELAHVIVGPESLRRDAEEGYLMFPLDLALARAVARRVRCSVARRQLMRAVRDYAACTQLMRETEIYLDDVGGFNGAFYKEAFRRAVRVGLITAAGYPTWRRPVWRGIAPLPPKAWFARWRDDAHRRGLL